jgi:hypothetical protein
MIRFSESNPGMPHYHLYYHGEALSCEESEADVRIALAELILRLRALGAEVISLPDGNSFLVHEAGTSDTKFLSWLEGHEDDCPNPTA